MLRFNHDAQKQYNQAVFISIHLMLRFNILLFYYMVFGLEISIHLMLRFNLLDFLFQLLRKYFNTSYVTVQLLHLCILYFSSYQIVVAVSTFFIIFSNDKYFFSQKSKTSLKAWKHQALSIPLSFCSWKTATIKTWKQKETAMAKQQPLKSFVFFIQSWYRL